MNTTELLQEADRLIAIPLEDRTIAELHAMSTLRYKISSLIPYAKKDMKTKEIEVDTLEKETFLRLKSAGGQTQEEIKAKARLNRNTRASEVINLEFIYIQLYNFYQELDDQVASTRLVLKNLTT